MPRGYVRTGKNADPEFRSQRARTAQAAQVTPAARIAGLAEDERRGLLTDEDRAALRRIAEAAPAPSAEQIETLRPILAQER